MGKVLNVFLFVCLFVCLFVFQVGKIATMVGFEKTAQYWKRIHTFRIIFRDCDQVEKSVWPREEP